MTARFLSYGANVTSTTEVVLYTCPVAKKATVGSIVVCEKGGTAEPVSVYWTDSTDDTDYYVLSSYSVAANDTFALQQSPIYMQAGDTLNATLDGAGDVDIVIAVSEQFAGV